MAGDKKGRQFVPNTSRAASASRKIRSRKSAINGALVTKSALDENNEKRLSHEPPTIDMASLRPVEMPDGSMASIRPITFEHEGMHVVIPTVNETGELLSDGQAIAKYLKSSWHIGKFGDARSAERYASLLREKDIQQNVGFEEVSNAGEGNKKRRFVDARAVRQMNDAKRKENAEPNPKTNMATRESYISLFGESQ